MKKIIFVIGIISIFINVCYGADSNTKNASFFEPTQWLSQNSKDVITIQNAAGLFIVVLITVDKGSSNVVISNCANVTKINAGSSAICPSDDPDNPIALSSESSTIPAKGTYQIKQQ